MGFPTTINPIFQNGLVPVFVDARLDNYNINENKIEKANAKGLAIVAHTLGNPFNLEKVSRIAKKYNLYLIEDCCDALGANTMEKRWALLEILLRYHFIPLIILPWEKVEQYFVSLQLKELLVFRIGVETVGVKLAVIILVKVWMGFRRIAGRI